MTTVMTMMTMVLMMVILDSKRDREEPMCAPETIIEENFLEKIVEIKVNHTVKSNLAFCNH